MYGLTIGLIFFVFFVVVGVAFYFLYRRNLRKAKIIERALKMVPILIHLPPPSDDTEKNNRDVRDVVREKISQAEVLYNLIAGTAQKGFKSGFYGQRHMALEIVADSGESIRYYAAVPIALVSVVEQAVVTAYPGARLEEAEDHNIFSETGKLPATMGGEMVLKEEPSYPIATFKQLERDPLEALMNVFSSLEKGDGAAVQILIRPAKKGWIKRSVHIVAKKRHVGYKPVEFTAGAMLKAAVIPPKKQLEKDMARGRDRLSTLQQSVVDAIEDKTKYPAYETLIRLVVSTPNVNRSQKLLQDMVTTFALYDAPSLNGFKYAPTSNIEGLVTAFDLRMFPPELNNMILNSVELATLFHLPDNQFTATSLVTREWSKQVDGPPALGSTGLLLGYNEFRGARKEIRLAENDRRRHTYIVGQTGSGKSVLLENLAVQDMLSGNGFAFIDPHGDTAEKLLGLVPKNRAEDVVYFNPGDTDNPLGLNIFEFSSPEQKDFLVQEAINMLYKLYDPGHTGIIGPRYEHWFRNAALTLMSDPNGATFIEIPKVFTDSNYLKSKFKYLTDPTVIDFWTKEMAQTSDYHKSEMLGWFVSKFGAFMSNEMMRNIIGQTKSAFNLREIMDQKKILIVNLSKGRVGELNSQLLGMIFVIKFQAAAMSRANMPEAERADFCLYVDEFQNFSTDSFASILSEARKYRLNLIVANQFISQLTPEIRDAVFGNVGSVVSFRTGPEDAEFLVKQFAPVFDSRDLINLPIGHAVMRLLVNGLPSQPFTISTLPPLTNFHPELLDAMKQLSAAKFGIPRAEVEADIFGRLQSQPTPSPTDTASAQITTTPPASTTPPTPVATAPKPTSSTSTPASTPAPQSVAPAGPAPAVTSSTSATSSKPAPQPTPPPAPRPIQTSPQPASSTPDSDKRPRPVSPAPSQPASPKPAPAPAKLIEQVSTTGGAAVKIPTMEAITEQLRHPNDVQAARSPKPKLPPPPLVGSKPASPAVTSGKPAEAPSRPTESLAVTTAKSSSATGTTTQSLSSAAVAAVAPITEANLHQANKVSVASIKPAETSKPAPAGSDARPSQSTDKPVVASKPAPAPAGPKLPEPGAEAIAVIMPGSPSTAPAPTPAPAKPILIPATPETNKSADSKPAASDEDAISAIKASLKPGEIHVMPDGQVIQKD